jgi:uncharacterized membrane protein
MHQRLAAALTFAACLWVAILVATPHALTTGSFAGPAATVYASASRICHQRPERSFHAAGIKLPVCARCFGLYAAGALGALLAWGSGRIPGPRSRLLLIVSAVPTAATWLLEVVGLAAFSNLSRALAALPLGVVAGWVFVQMLRYDFLLHGQIDHSGSRVRSC